MTPRECPVAHYHMPRTCAAGLIETCPNRVPSHEAELRKALKETMDFMLTKSWLKEEDALVYDRARAALQKEGAV